MRFVVAFLFVLASTQLFSCGGDSHSTPKEPSTTDLAKQLRAMKDRVAPLANRPWSTKIAFLGQLIDFASRLDEAATACDEAPSGSESADLRKRAVSLLEAAETPLGPCIRALESIAPSADVLFALAAQIPHQIQLVGASPEDVFRLRTTYEDGWLRSEADAWRLLQIALEHAREKKDDGQNLRVLAGNLDNVKKEGETLTRNLSTLVQHLQAATLKFERQHHFLRFANSTVATAKLHEKDLDPTLIPAAQQAIEKATQDLTAAESRWPALRKSLLAATSTATTEADKALQSLDQSRLSLLTPTFALSRKLGIPDPK